MERIMSAEDLFEIEQQRIHEDLAQALFESEKSREEKRRLRHPDLEGKGLSPWSETAGPKM